MTSLALRRYDSLICLSDNFGVEDMETAALCLNQPPCLNRAETVAGVELDTVGSCCFQVQDDQIQQQQREEEQPATLIIIIRRLNSTSTIDYYYIYDENLMTKQK